MHSCFDSIRHLHISHNAPYLPSPPPPKKNCNSIVFNNKGYAKFRRAKNLQYGRCACKWRIQTSNAICEKKYEIAACVINLWGWMEILPIEKCTNWRNQSYVRSTYWSQWQLKSLKLWRLTKDKIPWQTLLKVPRESSVYQQVYLFATFGNSTLTTFSFYLSGRTNDFRMKTLIEYAMNDELW